MNTFEHVYKQFPQFLELIAATKPNIIVPVARKGCKLLRAASPSGYVHGIPIRYKKHFELFPSNLAQVRIAVLDDATQHTATLLEYRRFFERRGATVDTFSWVGHDSLRTGSRHKLDDRAQIGVYLSEPLYQEYILQQSRFLLNASSHFDLDHLVFNYDFTRAEMQLFLSQIKEIGCLLNIDDSSLYASPSRFVLSDLDIHSSCPFFADSSITIGSLCKLKILAEPALNRLTFSPMVFPTWNYADVALGYPLLRSTPFTMPFPRDIIRRKGDANELRAYFNLQFAAMTSLAKAFTQVMTARGFPADSVTVRCADLDSVLGPELAQQVGKSNQAYVRSSALLNCKSHAAEQCLQSEPKRHFQSFGQLVDYLKRAYETKAKRRRKRVGIHEFISYEQLYLAFYDRRLLDVGLDYYCDLGVLVPETVKTPRRFERACRTGEPSYDYPWYRTEVIIVTAMDRLLRREGQAKQVVAASVLIKVLACFLYDYPSDLQGELHCFVGLPDKFGSLVRVRHSLRAPHSPTLYQYADRSRHVHFDTKARNFSIKSKETLVASVQSLFDERQEVPFTEIVSYFEFLALLSGRDYGLSNVNMLSICREEHYFYSHVLHNVVNWLVEMNAALDAGDESQILRFVQSAATEVNSARAKLEMIRSLPVYLERLREEFSDDLLYKVPLERLCSNYRPSSDAFKVTLVQLDNLAGLESMLSNYALTCLTRKKKHFDNLVKYDWLSICSSFELDATAVSGVTLDTSKFNAEFVRDGAAKVASLMANLPREEPLLASRLEQHALDRAKNVATRYVAKHGIKLLVLQYVDLSGLRQIPEPKEDIVSRYYQVIKIAAHKRLGYSLYGGQDGDDAFTLIFLGVEAAIQFARDVKAEFRNDLFLSSYDVKFGLCVRKVESGSIEISVINAWGDAKECCSLKTASYKNKGDLVLSRETLDVLSNIPGFQFADQLVPIPESVGVELSGYLSIKL